MTSDIELIRVLTEVRQVLLRPGNDFAWSGWDDADEAVAEIDAAIARLAAGDGPALGVTILFAPTGPLQEVALSSGWGDEFLALADRFDAARGR